MTASAATRSAWDSHLYPSGRCEVLHSYNPRLLPRERAPRLREKRDADVAGQRRTVAREKRSRTNEGSRETSPSQSLWCCYVGRRYRRRCCRRRRRTTVADRDGRHTYLLCGELQTYRLATYTTESARHERTAEMQGESVFRSAASIAP